jgi:hypothetical protein
MNDEQLIFETLGAMVVANVLTACIGGLGVALMGLLALRPKPRNPGLLFGGLGFAFIALANVGFALQGIAGVIAVVQNANPRTALELVNSMNCAFSVTAMVGMVSLILGFLYTYRRFLPSWREIIIDEGDGPF